MKKPEYTYWSGLIIFLMSLAIQYLVGYRKLCLKEIQEWKVHPNDLTHAVLPHKVIFVFDTPEKTLQAKKMAMERFPEGDFERSWPTGLELLSPGAGKGNAVCFLREVLEKEGRPVKKLICAGDFENDISMIKAADMGYAVANATPDCKEAADRVTVSCDENAIAVIIRELEEEME